MLDEIFLPLLEHTYTVNDLYGRLATMKEYYELRAYSADAQEKNKSLAVFLEEKKLDSATVTALSEWEGYFHERASGAEEVLTVIHDLHEHIQTLPTIVLYLPMIFEADVIAGIAGWFRNGVRKNILLEVKIDADVTGGCALIWNGVYYDFSLRYFMQKTRTELLSQLNEYGSHA